MKKFLFESDDDDMELTYCYSKVNKELLCMPLDAGLPLIPLIMQIIFIRVLKSFLKQHSTIVHGFYWQSTIYICNLDRMAAAPEQEPASSLPYSCD